jgi:hypothetical protein
MKEKSNTLLDKIRDGARKLSKERCEQCCGSCCHFKYEETDGWGQCVKVLQKTGGIASTHCSDLCICHSYASEGFKRHQMAVLRKCQRCLKRNIGTEQDLDVEDVSFAIDFLIDYAKTY